MRVASAYQTHSWQSYPPVGCGIGRSCAPPTVESEHICHLCWSTPAQTSGGMGWDMESESDNLMFNDADM